MPEAPSPHLPSIARLRALMQSLRDPESGCPWDINQSFETIAPYTIEEAYEVADAIQREAWSELKAELGDLLFQVIFHAQMADEKGLFDFDDVADAITEKMIRRHPHVFDTPDGRSAHDQVAAWEDMKAAERTERNHDGDRSLLNDVPMALPALMRAEKLQKRAARVGFDWDNPEGVFEKLDEEVGELKDAIAEASDAARPHGDPAINEEFGDVLFTIVSLGRHLGLDAEVALRQANEKFSRRFRTLEKNAAKRHKDINSFSPAEWEAAWAQVKSRETKS
ncbi:MAG: nucleoside triphosphate pyrophosphohydrolase [Pseudomonadota bacterium]